MLKVLEFKIFGDDLEPLLLHDITSSERLDLRIILPFFSADTEKTISSRTVSESTYT